LLVGRHLVLRGLGGGHLLPEKAHIYKITGE